MFIVVTDLYSVVYGKVYNCQQYFIKLMKLSVVIACLLWLHEKNQKQMRNKNLSHTFTQLHIF